MRGVKRIIGLLVVLLAGVGGRAQVTERITVFAAGDEGSRHYRIPALAVASDGSLIAVADRRGASQRDLPNIISVVCRRSTDGGRTWSPQRVIAQGDSATGATYGDAALIRDACTGALVCVFTGDRGFFDSTPEHPQRIYCSRSFDNGLTWEAPRDISAQFRLPGWQGFFAASGALTQTKEGRLLFVADTRLSPERRLRDIYEYVIASDDGGETWRVLNPQARVPSDGRGNESKVVELTDGRLLMSIRTPGCRRFSYSADGGRTWSEADSVPQLVEPDCNGDIIAVERGGRRLLLHSLPADAQERCNVSVYVSADEGTTWPLCIPLSDAPSAYSSLAGLPDGTIGCLLEEEDPADPAAYRILLVRFTLPDIPDNCMNAPGLKADAPGCIPTSKPPSKLQIKI